MNISQELFIAFRYFGVKHSNAFIAIVSRLSMIGIALGVATLIVVLAVMNGFERELRQRILSFTSHLVLLPALTHRGDWQKAENELRLHPEIRASIPFVRKEAVLSTRQELKGVVLYGVDPAAEERARSLTRQIKHGTVHDLIPGDYGVLIGEGLAEDLYLDLGDKILLMSPAMNRTAFGIAPRSRRFEIRGIFASGMNAFDNHYIYAHLRDVNTLMGEPNHIGGMRAWLHQPDKALYVARQLQPKLYPNYIVRNWTQDNQSFFRAIEIEKRVMAVILTLIIAVAVFNVLSSLVMLVSEKRADIAILRAMGMSKAAIMRIFMYLSVVIGFIGTVAGVILGLVLAFNVESIVDWLEGVLGTQVLVTDVYLVDIIPSETRADQVLLLTSLSLGLSLLASLYPAWKAGHNRPAQVLRHE